jgi:hypothetical protein
MTRYLSASLFVAAALISSPALADQCAALEEADGAKIFALIEKAGAVSVSVLSYCEPCGDTHATEVAVRTKDLTFAKEEGDAFFLLKNNGRVVDAAYVYVPVASGPNAIGLKQAKRLSTLAGLSCEASGLVGPASITYDASGKVLSDSSVEARD